MEKEEKKPRNNLKIISLLCIIFLGSVLFVNASSNVLDLASDVKDYFIEVARGNVGDTEAIHKFGNNPDIDSSEEDLWNGGGHYTGQDPTSAEIVQIISADADDTEGGTGANNITVYGLDANYNEIEENITLTGSYVNTTKSYIRLNRAKIREVGSSGTNEGTITIRQSITTANVFAVLPANAGQTLIGAYTIPADKTGYALSWQASLSKKTAGSSEVRIRVREFNQGWRNNELILLTTTGTSYVQRHYGIMNGPIPEKTDIKISADSDVNNMGVSGGFDLIIVDN